MPQFALNELPNSAEAGSDEAANFTHKQAADGRPGSDDQNSPRSAMWRRRLLVFRSVTHEICSKPFILQCEDQGSADPSFLI